MSRKRGSRKKSHGPGYLEDRLQEIEKLTESGELELALNILQELKPRYGSNPAFLSMLAFVHLRMENALGFLETMRKLYRLNPHNPEVLQSLIFAYLDNSFFGQAYLHFQKFIQRWPNHPEVRDLKKLFEEFQDVAEGYVEKLHLSPEEGIKLAAQNEEIQFLVRTGELNRAQKTARKLLKQYPDFPPALNNLSLVHSEEGNLQAAIQTCEKVLEVDPGNVHALSNITRFAYLLGKADQARDYAEKLKKLENDHPDAPIKKVEALCLIGDDTGVLKVLSQVEKTEDWENLSDMFFHWCAVSAYRTGKTAKAKKLWLEAQQRDPFNPLANANLEELKKPVHERICPQAFQIHIILGSSIGERMTSQLSKKNHSAKLTRFVQQTPAILHFYPQMLRYGDEMLRDFAIDLARACGHPDLLNMLKEFALSQDGPDRFRMRAAFVLTEWKLFQEGEDILIWQQGERRPMQTLSFEIVDGPTEDGIPLQEEAITLVDQGLEALQEGNGELAEKYLRKALEIQPEHPSLLNNLALSLKLQEKPEARTIMQHVMHDFPDYFFGQMQLAREHIRQGNLKEAEEIIGRWSVKKRKFHPSEFRTYCVTQLELHFAQKNVERAANILSIWRQLMPDDPAIELLEQKLEMVKAIKRLKQTIRK